MSLVSLALAGGFFTPEPSGEESQNEVVQSCPTLGDPVDCSLTGSSVQGILQARILEWVPFPSPGDLANPGIKPWSPALEADALTSEPYRGSPVSVLPPSKGNQLCVYRYSLFFEFPSHIGHHRRLSRVPYAAPVVTHYLSMLDAVSGI